MIDLNKTETYINRKTILFVGNTAWSMYNFRLEVIKSFSQDYNVIVLAPDDAWGNKLLREGITYIPIIIDNKGTSPLKDLKLLWALFKLYKKINPSLIFHYTIKPNIYGTFAAFMCGKIKSIAVITGAGKVFCKKTLLTRFVKFMFRLSFQFPKEVWFLNEDDRELFISSKLVDRSKAVLLPGEGINTSEFFNDNDNDNVSSEKFSFLYLGRLLWEKGVGEYVEAARNIRRKRNDVVFQVLGFLDQRDPSAISSVAVSTWQKEGIINYLGSTGNVKGIIINSNCIVLPSSYREGIPRSLLEAASLEKPVIATDIPGCKEVVEDHVNGYLCEANNTADLQDKMERMLELSYEQRIRMGKAGREKIKRQFEISIILDQYRRSVLAMISIPTKNY